MSKIETAKQLPTESDLREWADAVGGTQPLEQLLERLERARAEYRSFRKLFALAGGAAGKQSAILALEARTAAIAIFQVAMIPGILQTVAYAQHVLHLPCGPGSHGAAEDDVEGMLALRMQRQQILYQPGRRIRVILLEAALRTLLVSPDAMLGQLDRLRTLVGLASLELGIIPFTSQVPVFPLSGFTVYDDDLVIVETVEAEIELGDPEAVHRYARFFGLLRERAVMGKEAASLINRAITDLQGEHYA